jgi:hypothetical protein
MTKKLRCINLAILAIACIVMAFDQKAEGQPSPTFADNPAEIVKKYDVAWNKKDSKTVSKILAPSYIYFTSDGKMFSRSETLDFLKSPKYKLSFAERSEIKTYRTGNTIVVSSRWIGRGTYGDEEINDDQRCGIILTKINKEWKIVSEHCTQIVNK